MLAWPCNQFGGQEPRPAAAVAEWARREYKASFPILSKVDVNGPKADPLWLWLKREKPASGLEGLLGDDIKWNFGDSTFRPPSSGAMAGGL